jgi:hypothetical protein
MGGALNLFSASEDGGLIQWDLQTQKVVNNYGLVSKNHKITCMSIIDRLE